MENVDELGKTKSVSSNPFNSSPNPLPVREEGELSSSSNDGENPSSAQSTGAVNPPAPSQSVLGPPPVNKLIQGIQAGKAISSTNPVINSVDIQSRTSVQQNNDKSFDKSRVPFKSGSPGWYASSGANNNLVISFSDEDSGSESEDYRQEKAIGSKWDTTGADGNRKLPSLPSAKSSKLQQTARNVNKAMPKKSSLSRTFISSRTKINGGANSRAVGPSLVEQGSRVRNFNSIHRNLASQENGFDQGVGLSNTKLRDLRERIALRERELKLKATLQNKVSASVSGRDCNAMNLFSDAARKSANSADTGQLEPKQPDKKRLKVSGSYSTRLNLDSGQEIIVAKSILPPKVQALENSSLEDRNTVDCSQKRSPTRRAESKVVKRQQLDDKWVDISSTNIPRANIFNNCSQSDRSSAQKSIKLNDPIKNCERQPPGSFSKTATSEQNLMNSCEYREGRSVDNPFLNSICQASLNNVSLWNCLSTVNVAEHSDKDMQSLVEMEESLDKELEEAQDHRCRCEIEERNAFKAYRKAQRALIEANSRCTELYRKRELHSAHFRSFIMSDSSLLWSSRQHEHVGLESLDPGNDGSRNVNLMPTSSNQIQPQYDGCNQLGYESDIHCGTGAPQNMSYLHVNGHNLGSEPCSEPAASTSEPLPHTNKNAANGVSSPSNDPDISADEDEEMFSSDHEAVQPYSKNKEREQNSVGRQKDTNHHSNKNFSADGSQDSFIYEATLRSKLVSRLGMRTLSKNGGSSNIEAADELGTENENGSERTQTSNGSVPFSETEKDQECDIGGNDKSERSIAEAPIQIRNHGKNSLGFHSAAGSDDISIGRHHLTTSIILSPPLVLRSAFSHLKVMTPNISSRLWSGDNQQDNTCDYYNEGGGCINSGEMQLGNVIANTMVDSVMDTCGTEIGLFNCNIAVDPFWPLCMYELRGKCNNDECLWQHVRDFSGQNVHQHQLDDSDSADCQVGLTLHRQKCNGGTNLSKRHSVVTSPTYLVGLDILKAEPHSYLSFVSRRNGECWWKCFSFCLALSSLLQKDVPADEPFLRCGDGRIEVYGNRRHSAYFQSGNSIVNHVNLASASNVQSLEMALLILSQEANKLEGRKKALSVLSRAVEADPASEILWIIYLLIYYSNIQSVGKDDMFSHAVNHDDGSYALWLMYINSRLHLDDRLVAYDAALKALCHLVSASDRDEMHASACILDLFLQMLDCLCMSGNVDKAIQKIYGLFPELTNSDEPHSLSLSDILTCLTVSDKYMFWVCCVYLVIYRKLPDAVVQRFECEKELLAIEWPSVHLPYEEKQRAVKLVEKALDSVKLYVHSELLESETNLRSAQHFSLNHIRCMVALDGLDCCQNLLDKYLKLYPSCVEFVLISARARAIDFGNLNFEGFEEAISNWPKEVPGIHCIWNQYVEYALQKGNPDFAKELILRWFNSVAKVSYPQNEKLDVIDSNSWHGSLESVSASNPDFLIPISNHLDTMFGFINLSLAKLFQNDHVEARFAIDRAFKTLAPHYMKHCLREHAMFLLTYELQLKKDAPISEQLNILNGYLDDIRAFPVSQPLSREFINNIEKPKVRQLITNILSPVSSDFLLVNLVLEVWYGPSLLPPKLSQPKELVDFVEAILEIVPSNYQLAFSVCKLFNRGYNSVDVTSGSILYWASSTLVNAIFHAVPIAPEYVWVEAACILGDIPGIEMISDRFYKRALSVYPFSRKLWNCYYNLSKTTGNASTVGEAAREKGIKVG